MGVLSRASASEEVAANLPAENDEERPSDAPAMSGIRSRPQRMDCQSEIERPFTGDGPQSKSRFEREIEQGQRHDEAEVRRLARKETSAISATQSESDARCYGDNRQGPHARSLDRRGSISMPTGGATRAVSPQRISPYGVLVVKIANRNVIVAEEQLAAAAVKAD